MPRDEGEQRVRALPRRPMPQGPEGEHHGFVVFSFHANSLGLQTKDLVSKFGSNQIWPTRSPCLEKLYLFQTISNEDDFYIKIIALDEIYNFIVFSFLFKILRYFKKK